MTSDSSPLPISPLRTRMKGIHAVLAVPLMREDKVVGGLVIRRRGALRASRRPSALFRRHRGDTLRGMPYPY